MDALTFRILVALRAGAADGSALLGALEADDAGSAPSLPTLYRCLRTCRDNGWILEEAVADAGPGRPPKQFRIADAGLDALSEEARRHLRMAELVLGPTDDGGADR